eukprot:Hpha_TRINITY_DN15325_c1_g1::TRINITY_DN15325_c1_g1_i2::g.87802::m.87802
MYPAPHSPGQHKDTCLRPALPEQLHERRCGSDIQVRGQCRHKHNRILPRPLLCVPRGLGNKVLEGNVFRTGDIAAPDFRPNVNHHGAGRLLLQMNCQCRCRHLLRRLRNSDRFNPETLEPAPMASRCGGAREAPWSGVEVLCEPRLLLHPTPEPLNEHEHTRRRALLSQGLQHGHCRRHIQVRRKRGNEHNGILVPEALCNHPGGRQHVLNREVLRAHDAPPLKRPRGPHIHHRHRLPCGGEQLGKGVTVHLLWLRQLHVYMQRSTLSLRWLCLRQRHPSLLGEVLREEQCGLGGLRLRKGAQSALDQQVDTLVQQPLLGRPISHLSRSPVFTLVFQKSTE